MRARSEANQIVADTATDMLSSDTNTRFWTKVGSRMAAEVIDKNYTTIATFNDFYNELYFARRHGVGPTSYQKCDSWYFGE